MNTFPPPFPRTPTNQTSFSAGLNPAYPSPLPSPIERAPSSPSISSSTDSNSNSNSPIRPNHRSHTQANSSARYGSTAPSPIINVTTSSPPAPSYQFRRTSDNSPISAQPPGRGPSTRTTNSISTGTDYRSPARILALGVGPSVVSSPGSVGSGSGSRDGSESVRFGSTYGAAAAAAQGGVSDVPLDVETVLRHTNGDVLAGLRQVIEERNSLAQQNSQLWKLMEKYRARVADVVKERERYRAERDGAVSQLSDRGEEADSPLSSGRTMSAGVGGGMAGRPRAGTVTAATGGLDADSSLKRPAAPPRASSENVSPRTQPVATFASNQLPTPAERELPLASPLARDSNLRGRTLSSTSLTSEPQLSSQGSSFSFTGQSGSNSAPTSPLEVVTSGPNMARGIPIAPSPLSQEVSYLPSSSSGGMTTARPHLVPNPLLPSPPMHGVRTQSPDVANLPSRQSTLGPEPGTRMRKASDIPRSPSYSQAIMEERERQNNRAQSMSATNVLADQGVGMGISRTSTNDSVERARSEREGGSASPDIVSLYGHGSSVHSASQPSPQLPVMQQSSPTKISLTSQLLPYTRCDIPAGRIIQNAQGKDVLSFDIQVTLKPPGTGRTVQWNAQKLFSAFLELDEEVSRKTGGRRGARAMGIVSLPDGRARKDAAPSKADQRRSALEAYLQSVLAAPLDDKSALCRFLTTGVVDGTVPTQMSAQGRKVGYLTKKGKNLGGWKSRFFLLDGLSLHYFEKRDGEHLGTIVLTAAQIGRQHKDPKSDDGSDKAYRHAFLILEEDRRKNGHPTRHVLCAESDNDRDAWVQALVRAVRGDFIERSNPDMNDPRSAPSGRHSTDSPDRARKSISSDVIIDSSRNGPVIPRRQQSREESPISTPNLKAGSTAPGLAGIAEGPLEMVAREHPVNVPRGPVHIPQASGSSVAGAPNIPSSASAPVDGKMSLSGLGQDNRSPPGRRGSGKDSIADSPIMTPTKPARPQSMMPFKSSPVVDTLKNHVRGPQLNTSLQASPRDIPESPDKDHNRIQRGQISGPTGGAPIPHGFRFGAARDPAAEQQEKERKHKSMRLWGFGKQGPVANQPAAKPVFGTTLAESVAIAEVANLPAVLFRCIKYLEAKHAEREEGIFRLSGSSAVIRALKDRFDAEGDIDLIAKDEHWDLHAIAGLLKLFLRELSTSLLTLDLHMDFVRVLDLAEVQDRVREFARLVAALPLTNYSLLRALISHLILIATNSDVNKMTLRNIGIVFSPTLGLPAGIFFDLVAHFQAIFDPDPEDDVESLASPLLAPPLEQRFSTGDAEVGESSASEPDTSLDDTPRPRRQPSGAAEYRNRKNRNSMIYAAESDPMLGSKGRQMPGIYHDGRRSSITSEDETYLEEESMSESGEGGTTVQEHVGGVPGSVMERAREATVEARA